MKRLIAWNSTRALQLNQILRFTAFIIGTIITARTLQNTELFEIETVLMLSSTVSFFWVAGLTGFFMASGNEVDELKSNIRNAFWCLVLFSLISHTLAVILIPSLYKVSLIKTGGYWVYSFFTGISYLLEYYLYKVEKTKVLIWISIITNLLYVACFSLIYFQISLSICLWLLGIVGFIRLMCFAVYPGLTVLFTQISTRQIWKFIVASAPLMFTFLFSGSMPYVDGHIVRFYFNTNSDFLNFQYGARELPIISLLAGSLSSVMSRHINLYKVGSASIRAVKIRSLRLMRPMFAISILFVFITPLLFNLIYKNRFNDAPYIFIIYLLIAIPRLIFPQSIMVGLHNNKQLMTISVIEWVMNLVLSIILLQFIGLYGIALATVLAYIFDKVASIYVLNRQGIRLKQYTPIKEFSLYSTLLILSVALVFSIKYFN
ncbi:MAG: polysaccharide biosynthesis C-terminal domain-containing protein [Bacteroidota bacterium]|nr:polysaccharide biosynthesis C-terminal domain-containing protein [Bacteroidota bacterium]